MGKRTLARQPPAETKKQTSSLTSSVRSSRQGTGDLDDDTLTTPTLTTKGGGVPPVCGGPFACTKGTTGAARTALPSRAELHSASSVSSTVSRLDIRSIRNDYKPRPTAPGSSSSARQQQDNRKTPNRLPLPPRTSRPGTSHTVPTLGGGVRRNTVTPQGSSVVVEGRGEVTGGKPGSNTPSSGRAIWSSHGRSTQVTPENTTVRCRGIKEEEDADCAPLPRLLPSREGPRSAGPGIGRGGGGGQSDVNPQDMFPLNNTGARVTSPPAARRKKSSSPYRRGIGRVKSPQAGPSNPEGMSDQLLDLLQEDREEVQTKYSQDQHLSDWTDNFNDDLVEALDVNHIYEYLVADATPGKVGASVEEKVRMKKEDQQMHASAANMEAALKQKSSERLSAQVEEQFAKIKLLGSTGTNTALHNALLAAGSTAEKDLKEGTMGGAGGQKKARGAAGVRSRLNDGAPPQRVKSPPQYVTTYDPTAITSSPLSSTLAPTGTGFGGNSGPREKKPGSVLMQQAQNKSRAVFFNSLTKNSTSSLSTRLLKGVPGRGAHQQIVDSVERLKKQQMDDIFQRGAEAVFGKEPSFMTELLAQGGGEGVVVLRKRNPKRPNPPPKPNLDEDNFDFDDVAGAHAPGAHTTADHSHSQKLKHEQHLAEVRQRKMQQDEFEMGMRQARYNTKMGLATSSGVNAAFCAKTYLTWIAVTKAGRAFANTFAQDWDPFDDTKRDGTLFHPKHTKEWRAMMVKAGMRIKMALIRFFKRTQREKRKRAIVLLIGWLRMMHNDQKLKFAVQHFLARIRRIQKNWRRWSATSSVRVTVWAKQYLQQEKKLIQLVTLEKELAAATEVEGNMGGGSPLSPNRKAKAATSTEVAMPIFITEQPQALCQPGSDGEMSPMSPGLVGDFNTFLMSSSQAGPKLTGKLRDQYIVEHLLREHRSVADLLPKLRAFNGTFKTTDPEHVLAEMNQLFHESKVQRAKTYSRYLAWVNLKKASEAEKVRWEEENKAAIDKLRTGNAEVDKAYLEAAQLNTPLPPPPPKAKMTRYVKRRTLVELFLRLHDDRYVPQLLGEKDEDEAAKNALSAATRQEAEMSFRKKKSFRRQKSASRLGFLSGGGEGSAPQFGSPRRASNVMSASFGNLASSGRGPRPDPLESSMSSPQRRKRGLASSVNFASSNSLNKRPVSPTIPKVLIE